MKLFLLFRNFNRVKKNKSRVQKNKQPIRLISIFTLFASIPASHGLRLADLLKQVPAEELKSFWSKSVWVRITRKIWTFDRNLGKCNATFWNTCGILCHHRLISYFTSLLVFVFLIIFSRMDTARLPIVQIKMSKFIEFASSPARSRSAVPGAEWRTIKYVFSRSSFSKIAIFLLGFGHNQYAKKNFQKFPVILLVPHVWRKL